MVLLLLECKPLTALKGIYCCWTLLYFNVYWITSFFYAQISNLSKSTLLSGVFVYFKLNKNQEKTFPYVECFSLQWCNYSFMLGLFNHDISQWKKGFQSALCLYGWASLFQICFSCIPSAFSDWPLDLECIQWVKAIW